MNQKLFFNDYINETLEADSPASVDLALLKRIVHGEEDALAALYQKYSSPLYHYLLQLVLDYAAAEDIVQEVFLAVWHGAANFRKQATVKTWLFKIAHYQGVTWLRRHVRGGQSGVSYLVAADDAEDRAFEGWIKEQIRQALQKLSPDHRAVVELTFYHGMSYTEIAEVMSCPVGTVKSRMSYARRYLIEELKDVNFEINEE